MRIRNDAAALYAGHAWLTGGVRFVLWCCTVLWVPVLLLPGDTTDRAASYATIIWLSGWLRLPGLPPLLFPPELLVAAMAGGCATFSAIDYLVGGSRFSPAPVYVAGIFWVGLTASYALANPIGYGTWLFAGITWLHWWCLTRVRA